MSFSTGPKEFQRNLPNAKGKDDSVLFCNDDRGREAQNPGEIPPKGWVDVARRTWKEISDANLFLVAGGVTYAILLALFPGLAALISIYGLLLDPSQIEYQVGALSGVLPYIAIAVSPDWTEPRTLDATRSTDPTHTLASKSFAG